jgi:Ca2+-binding EF-hand superfamily protein
LNISKWTILGLFILSSSIEAQTMIPKIDQEGRRGEVARLAKQRAMEKFDTADENKDGKLSRQELEKNFPYLVEKFNERDKDRDGFLSWDEYIGHDRWPRQY